MCCEESYQEGEREQAQNDKEKQVGACLLASLIAAERTSVSPEHDAKACQTVPTGGFLRPLLSSRGGQHVLQPGTPACLCGVAGGNLQRGPAIGRRSDGVCVQLDESLHDGSCSGLADQALRMLLDDREKGRATVGHESLCIGTCGHQCVDGPDVTGTRSDHQGSLTIPLGCQVGVCPGCKQQFQDLRVATVGSDAERAQSV
mmetsp:Transcript_33258/g.50259  ORF Transcript_33258/g.50259 Transcript_33258/m.50259 type:complete len:202 (-) Transcript_33258:620-1225(-)